MRRSAVNYSDMLPLLIVLLTVPSSAICCVFLADDAKPKGLEERALDSEVVLAAYTRTVYRSQNNTTSYSAEFLVFNILKGESQVMEIFQRRKPSSLETALNRRLVNASNFGDPSKCQSDVNPGETYILFFDVTADGQLTARYDGVYGPAVVYTRDKEVALEVIGSSPWSEWSPCSGSCGGGIQQRRRQCDGNGKCSVEEGQQRTCNMFVCKGTLNALTAANVHRSSLRPSGRPTAYKLLPSGSWRSREEEITFPRTFPWEFSLLVTVRARQSSSGGFLLRVLHSGSLQVGLYLSDTITLVLSDKDNIRVSFVKSLFDDHWNQIAFSVRRNTVSFFLNCEFNGKLPLPGKIRPFGGQPATVIVGSTGPQEIDAFQGDIEQITISGSPDDAEKQCNSTTQPLQLRSFHANSREEIRSRPFNQATQNDQLPLRGDLIDDEDFSFDEKGSGDKSDSPDDDYDEDYDEDEEKTKQTTQEKIPLKSDLDEYTNDNDEDYDEESDEIKVEDIIQKDEKIDDKVIKEERDHKNKKDETKEDSNKEDQMKDDKNVIVQANERNNLSDKTKENTIFKEQNSEKMHTEDKKTEPTFLTTENLPKTDIESDIEPEMVVEDTNLNQKFEDNHPDEEKDEDDVVQGSGDDVLTTFELAWSEWSPCSSTCNWGRRTRTSYCLDNGRNLDSCSEASLKRTETEACFTKLCPSTTSTIPTTIASVITTEGNITDPPSSFGVLHYKSGCRVKCLNGGTCYTPYKCFCPRGYYGSLCQYAKQICQVKCRNGGTCLPPTSCSCTKGYFGNECQYALCKPQCLNGGTCVAPNKCICPPGYIGKYCHKPVCPNGCKNGGECIAPNKCACRSGFTGKECSEPLCDPACQNGGECVKPYFCHCPVGTKGNFCEKFYCKAECQNGGTCIGPNKCSCPKGYTGYNCEKAYCPGGCLNGGICTKSGKCFCPYGYSGLLCEISKPCKFKEVQQPYKRGFKQKVATQVKVPCGAWGWKMCTKTKVHYETVYKTFFRTSYECEDPHQSTFLDYQKLRKEQ